MTAIRSGGSAKEVERQLGVTYKTAWRMCHNVRELMGSSNPDKLSGHVETDETYVGGRRKGQRGRGIPHKTAVLGMVEREGSIKAVPVENVQRKTLMPHIRPLSSQALGPARMNYALTTPSRITATIMSACAMLPSSLSKVTLTSKALRGSGQGSS